MKKLAKNYFKQSGQATAEMIIVTALVSIGIIAAFIAFGGEFAKTLQAKSPSATYKVAKTVNLESPNNIVTNVALSVGGNAVVPPIEKIVKQNLANGTYVQTSGSSGKLKELSPIMQAYASDIGGIATNYPTGPQANFVNALNNYKAVVDSAVARIYSSTSELDVKIQLLKLKATIGNGTAYASALQSALSAFAPTVSNLRYRTILNLYTQDMLNFPSAITYTVDNTVCQQVLSTNCDNTPAQTLALASAMESNLGSYTTTQKDYFNANITMLITKNYSQDLAPQTYNSSTLCSTLGGSVAADSCVIP